MRRVLAFLLLLVPVLAAALEVPYLSGRVNDNANMLSPEQEQRIEQKLAAFEQQGGAQVVVLTIPSLEGDPIEDFAVRTAQAWGLGQKEQDNGILLVIAQQDRRMRLEVGYGLEPVLTDLESGIVLDEVIRPRFQAGDFGGGIEAGVDAVLEALGGELTAPQPAARLPGAEIETGPKVLLGLLLVFVVGTFSLIAVATRGCQSWFLYLFLSPFYALFGSMIWPGIGAGLAIGWLVLFPILKLLAARTGFGQSWFPAGPSFGRRGRGGWIIGGGGFGGGGFGGGGGGGFSGGGGSFGGGGASGSW